jgi:hypothetical protein
MAKKQAFLRGAGVIKLLSDTDWITIINSLLTVNNQRATRLAKTLLAKTKHGRQVRLLRLIKQKRPRLADMQRAMGVTRRTIFRDLNCLEDYGVRLVLDEKYRYEIEHIPAIYKKLL